MTSLADSPRSFTLAQRMVAAWNALSVRVNPLAAIVVAWAALTFPLVFFRGFNSDEGLAVSIARTALEDGRWWIPHAFNIRIVERPMLLSWIISAVSWPFGHVSQISARAVVALFLLGGCLLIYFLLRKVVASRPAALFGTALFLACPLVIRSYVSILADLPLAVMLFFAFVLWWGGCDKGSVSLRRWTAIGVVLALSGLFKGPQPIAYFVLGIGLFILGSRAWRQIPGFILADVICAAPLVVWYASVYTPGDAGTWAQFMRIKSSGALPGPLTEAANLIVETLPATLLAVAYLLAQGMRGKWLVRADFSAALGCYAFAAPVVMLFWPGGSTARYYLPMVLPLCVFGGLGYNYLSAWRPQVVAPILAMSTVFLAYALVYSAAAPFMPMRYRQAEIDGANVKKLVQANPAPIYTIGAVALNVLPYVPGQIRNEPLDQLAALSGPAWLVVGNSDADTLLARRPDKLRVAMPLGEDLQWRLLWLGK
jgi:4-amino-4-deoxy-L-arabinose transferase-like glycosyltransferase